MIASYTSGDDRVLKQTVPFSISQTVEKIFEPYKIR